MDETEKKRSFETVEEWEAAVAHQGKRIVEAGPRFWQDRSLANAVYVIDPFVQLGITVFGR